MASKAPVTPQILRWARESAKITIEAAAAKVSITPERLHEWENGTSQPTMKQAETLSNMYRRPFALLFLPDIPRDFQPLQDYRRDDSIPLSTGSIFIIRDIQQKQAWLSEFNQENEEPPLPFIGKYNTATSSTVVASDILRTIGIEPGKYDGKPLNEWIDKIESNGIFVSRTSFIHSKLKLNSDEMQGFCIADRYAPFVFINSDDWSAPQLFTLIHELAHLWIAATGISNETEPHQISKNSNPVEIYCNEVAASVLMPETYLRSIPAQDLSSYDQIFQSAKKLGVSSFAFIFRLYNLGLINRSRYNSLKQDADAAFHQFLKRQEEKKSQEKASPGGPNPYLLRLYKNSKLFTRMVLETFRGGNIEASQASTLLNTTVNNFHQFEKLLYR